MSFATVSMIDHKVTSHPCFPTPSGDAALYADHNKIAVEHQVIIEEILVIFRDCETDSGWRSDTDFEAHLLEYVRNCMERQANPTWELLSIKKLWATIWYGEQRHRERIRPSNTAYYLFCAVAIATAFTVAIMA